MSHVKTETKSAACKKVILRNALADPEIRKCAIESFERLVRDEALAEMRESIPLEELYRARDLALERVITVQDGADGEVLNKALDKLVLAHLAATLRWVSGA